MHLAKLNLSPKRRRDYERFLDRLECELRGCPVSHGGVKAVGRILKGREREGKAPNTVRKDRAIAVAFFSWAFLAGHIDADSLLRVKALRYPPAATRRIQPNPYTAKEIRELWAVMRERWPKLDEAAAQRKTNRLRRGTGSYRAIREHAIRLQLEAVVALLLHGGLRRAEAFGLHLDDLHPDNQHIVIWEGERFESGCREVPFTQDARDRVAAWVDLRSAIGPDHARPWLSLWAAKTPSAPMARDTFDKLLVTYIGAGWNFRRLRHTAGVNWLRAGMSIWELQRLMGHRSLKDTLPYADGLTVALDSRVERLEANLARRLPLAA